MANVSVLAVLSMSEDVVVVLARRESIDSFCDFVEWERV